MPQCRCNSEQLSGSDMKYNDLIATGCRSDHANYTVKQQIEPAGFGTFLEYRLSFIEARRCRQVEDLTDLRAVQPPERRNCGQEAFV